MNEQFSSSEINAFSPATDALESEVPIQESPILSLANQLDYINPDLFKTNYDHFIREQELAQKRRSWLEAADEAVQAGNTMEAIRLLKNALEDLVHAGHYYDEIHQKTLQTIINQCLDDMYKKTARTAVQHAEIRQNNLEDTYPIAM